MELKKNKKWSMFKTKIEFKKNTKFPLISGVLGIFKKNDFQLLFSESKNKFDVKEKNVFDFLKNYNFELKKKYQIKSASFLCGIKATDNIFVNKSFYV